MRAPISVLVMLLSMAGCAERAQPPTTARVETTAAQPSVAQRSLAQPSERGAPWFHTNILKAATSNDAYRRVLFTGARSQLALMTIPPGSDIGVETHPHVEQLVFIAGGEGKATLGGVDLPVVAGDVLVLPPGTTHDILNTGAEPLRIYTIYAPPNHIDGRVHRTRADAVMDKADEAFGDAVR